MKINSLVMKEATEFKRGGCLNAWAWKWEGWKKPKVVRNAPCYATMASNKKIEQLGIAVRNLDADWFNYLANRSPLAHAFKTKRACVASRYGVEMNMDSPYPHVLSAAVFLRNMWEFPELIKSWKYLKRKGVDERVASLMIYVVDKEPREEKSWVKSFRGHTPFNQYNTEKDVKEFVKGNLNTPYKGTNDKIEFLSVLRQGGGMGLGAAMDTLSVKTGTGWEMKVRIPEDKLIEYMKRFNP